MRRLISALIALIILADAAPTVSAEPIGPAPGVTYCHVADRQHPTVGQLTAALVTLKELGLLGAGYTVESTGPLQGGEISVGATLVRSAEGGGTDGVLSLGLFDGTDISPDQVAQDYADGFTSSGREGQWWPVDALAIGPDTVAYMVIHPGRGQDWYAKVLAWRHGNVIAIVAAVGDAPGGLDATALVLARRQEQKLVATMPWIPNAGGCRLPPGDNGPNPFRPISPIENPNLPGRQPAVVP